MSWQNVRGFYEDPPGKCEHGDDEDACILCENLRLKRRVDTLEQDTADDVDASAALDALRAAIEPVVDRIPSGLSDLHEYPDPDNYTIEVTLSVTEARKLLEVAGG